MSPVVPKSMPTMRSTLASVMIANVVEYNETTTLDIDKSILKAGG